MSTIQSAESPGGRSAQSGLRAPAQGMRFALPWEHDAYATVDAEIDASLPPPVPAVRHLVVDMNWRVYPLQSQARSAQRWKLVRPRRSPLLRPDAIDEQVALVFAHGHDVELTVAWVGRRGEFQIRTDQSYVHGFEHHEAAAYLAVVDGCIDLEGRKRS